MHGQEPVLASTPTSSLLLVPRLHKPKYVLKLVIWFCDVIPVSQYETTVTVKLHYKDLCGLHLC